MSPLVTRPSLPEPGTVEASMPVSAESFRTDGASGASAGGAFGAGAGAGAGAADGLAAAGAAGAAGGGGGRGAIGDLAEQRADGNSLAILGDDLAERSS